VVRFFHPIKGVKIKLSGKNSVKGETLEVSVNAIKSLTLNYRITEDILAPVARTLKPSLVGVFVEG
jgi:hypothetical protein